MNYQHHPNPTRQRGIFHDRTAAPFSYAEAGHIHSSQLAAIEAGINVVENDAFKLLQGVAS